ncbi:FISUMP domain-containing protein, partial [candidate division KSB1 bacterium]
LKFIKMKNIIKISLAIFLGYFLLFSIGCKKDNDDPTPTKQLAVLTTSAATDISHKSATCGGNISSDGGYTVSARGVCWSTAQTPTIADNKTNDGTGAGNFISAITDLTPNTTYYVRAYAYNYLGTAYGNTISFKTNILTGVTDIDGNVYDTVIIGTQVWMTENLKTTKFNDGTTIPLVTDNGNWSSFSIPAFCWYNNDEATYKNPYGALYNWPSVNTGILCPTGWHVPNDADWDVLVNFAGGATVAGGKLKESGTMHWNAPNTSATNEYGFTAVPGGYRLSNGTFDLIGRYALIWSSTEDQSTTAWYRSLTYDTEDVVYINSYKDRGFSVRCIRD